MNRPGPAATALNAPPPLHHRATPPPLPPCRAEVLGLRLQPVSKQLVAALLPLTTAKRHRVRIAALQALRPTLHQVR